MINQHYIDLIHVLTKKELAVRYKHFALGYLWSIISPLVSVAIYYVVFQMIIKVQQPHYALFLVSGIYPWQWLSNSIAVAPTTFVNNSSLIKKTIFPRFLISLVIIIQDSIHFIMTLPIIIGMLLTANIYPTLHWIWAIPVLFVFQFATAYAINIFLASVTLFFRDVERFAQIIMSFAFYLTPILYSESMVPEKYKHLILLNPFALLVINWRNLFVLGAVNYDYLFFSAIWSLVLVILFHWIYEKLSWKFAELV